MPQINETPGEENAAGQPGGGITIDLETGTTGPVDKNALFSFLGTAQGMGIEITPNIRALAEEAVRKGYSTSAFLYFLRQTPEYAASQAAGAAGSAAAGREAEVRAYIDAIQNIGAQAGLDISDAQARELFQQDVSPTEFSMRAPAVARMRRYAPLFTAFRKELIQAGIPAKDVTRKSLLEFAAGMGNKKWADIWQDAVTRNAALEAGIQIKKAAGLKKDYTAIRQRLLERISAKGLSEAEMASGFQELAEHLLVTMPLSKLEHMGLNRRKLVQGEFGGPHQAEIRQKMKLVLETGIAAGEEQVTTSLSQSDLGGLQSVGRQPQSVE
jgi:hypothetical protein